MEHEKQFSRRIRIQTTGEAGKKEKYHESWKETKKIRQKSLNENESEEEVMQ